MKMSSEKLNFGSQAGSKSKQKRDSKTTRNFDWIFDVFWNISTPFWEPKGHRFGSKICHFDILGPMVTPWHSFSTNLPSFGTPLASIRGAKMLTFDVQDLIQNDCARQLTDRAHMWIGI